MPKRPTIGYRQLCAIAAQLLKANPSYIEEQADWKGAVKDRAHHLGFATPMGDIVGRALDATERVHTIRRAPPSPAASHVPSKPDDTPPGWSARNYRARCGPIR